MDADTYQRSVSESSIETARMVAVFGRIAIGATVVGACLLIAWLGLGNIVDKANVFFAWVGELPQPRIGFGIYRASLNVFFGLMNAVLDPFRWVATRHLSAILAATATVALGVYLAAFDLDAGQWRKRRRFWSRTPDQMVRSLAAWFACARFFRF